MGGHLHNESIAQMAFFFLIKPTTSDRRTDELLLYILPVLQAAQIIF